MRRKRIREESNLDLTPMLDIVFIMLIFFIVTTSFIKESGIEVNRPNAETAERDQKGNILVAISENNEIFVLTKKYMLHAMANPKNWLWFVAGQEFLKKNKN